MKLFRVLTWAQGLELFLGVVFPVGTLWQILLMGFVMGLGVLRDPGENVFFAIAIFLFFTMPVFSLAFLGWAILCGPQKIYQSTVLRLLTIMAILGGIVIAGYVLVASRSPLHIMNLALLCPIVVGCRYLFTFYKISRGRSK